MTLRQEFVYPQGILNFQNGENYIKDNKNLEFDSPKRWAIDDVGYH
jgi:hypothetical protein